MLVAELRILPIGSGSSMRTSTARALQAIAATGIRHEVGPVGTTLEAESLDELLTAVRAAHQALVGEVPRIVTELTIDHRLDQEETIASLEDTGVEATSDPGRGPELTRDATRGWSAPV